MVGLWCYNQSGVTELLIMRNHHYMVGCVLSQLKPSSSLGFILYITSHTDSVIIAIHQIVPQKPGARTIDCAMNWCVIVWSMIFILFYNDRFTSHCNNSLTLSSLNLPLSFSSTTSRKLLSQSSTCSGWRWPEVGDKLKKLPCIRRTFSSKFAF